MRVDNPYRIDLDETRELIARHRPELIILGRSLVLHPEPVAEIRRFLGEQDIDAVVLYDMAHVLGLVGPHFQEPFAEGADLVTGSTHKTFFGPQRGVVGSRFLEADERYDLWEALRRRTFPARSPTTTWGRSWACCLPPTRCAPSPASTSRASSPTRRPSPGRWPTPAWPCRATRRSTTPRPTRSSCGSGTGAATRWPARLERNNILCNYQGLPDEEAFTAAGGLRLGVAEMTRFGMTEADFGELALLLAAVVTRDADVAAQVRALRARFVDLEFCFGAEELGGELDRLVASVASGGAPPS